jgi:hypothetical protein
LDLSFVQFDLQKDNASLGPHFLVSIGNLPFWQFDFPIPIAFSFTFVGNQFLDLPLWQFDLQEDEAPF